MNVLATTPIELFSVFRLPKGSISFYNSVGEATH